MNEDKKRHTVWLTSDAWSQVETSYTKDNCTTKNEYIESPPSGTSCWKS